MKYTHNILGSVFCAILAILLPVYAFADYEDHPKTPQLLHNLKQNHGFTPHQIGVVLDALDEAERIDKLIQHERKSPEKVRPWYEYRPIHINEWNISNGVEFMRKYRTHLLRAEKKYGVPVEVITAIIGVETKYGNYTGKNRILDALATQGFDHPTRQTFFFNELEQFFVLCREMDIHPEEPKGSYAGAMGLAQFMPSNYRTLAVDFDGNGYIDLWEPVDAIGSVASYLANYRGPGKGWKPGQPVAEPVQTPAVKPVKYNASKHPESTTSALLASGIRSPSLRADGLPAGLVTIELPNGNQDWVAFENFFVIMSYNPRLKYAMSVYQLSQEIKARAG